MVSWSIKMHYPTLVKTRNGLYTRRRVGHTVIELHSLRCLNFPPLHIAVAASIVFAGRARSQCTRTRVTTSHVGAGAAASTYALV